MELHDLCLLLRARLMQIQQSDIPEMNSMKAIIGAMMLASGMVAEMVIVKFRIDSQAFSSAVLVRFSILSHRVASVALVSLALSWRRYNT